MRRRFSTNQFSPLEICQLNAHRKARAVAKKIPDALVLGADTLVFLDNEILGKPRNLADARRMLARLQGRTHQVVTGVSLIHLRAHRERIFAISTDVLFHPLDAGQIRDYLSRINPLDKAGAYAIQESGEKIISEISGSYSNVVGLPVERFFCAIVPASGLARRIGRTRSYTPVIGDQMGLIGPDDTTDVTATSAHPCRHRQRRRRGPEITFNKLNADGVHIYNQRDSDLAAGCNWPRKTIRPMWTTARCWTPANRRRANTKASSSWPTAEIGLESDMVEATARP